MRQTLITFPQDTLRVLHLLQIGNYFENENLDSSEWYYRQALALSRELNAPFFEGKTISWFTDVLNKQGKLNESLELNLRGYEIGKLLDHTRLTIASLSNIAATYQYLADYESTLKYQLEALPVLEKMGDQNFLSSALNNISGTYQLLRQYERAEIYAQRALEVSQKSQNHADRISALISLGVIANHLTSFEEALDYLHQALAVTETHQMPYEQGIILLNIGENYTQMGTPSLAIPYLTKGISLAENYGDAETQARLLLAMGNALIALEKFPEAAVFLDRAIVVAESNGFRDALKKIYLAASDAELALGHFDQYVTYRERYSVLTDSLINATVLQNTAEFETKYQAEKKQQEIERLEKEGEIQRLQLRQRQGIITALGIVLGLLAAVAFLYFQNLHNKQQLVKQQIELQENQILQLEQDKQLTAVDAMLRGQEVERTRLARDLHDGLGGMLSGVRQTLDAMKGNQIITEESARGFNRALEMLDSSIGELRRVARNMMPEALLKFGLNDAIRDMCDAINDTGKMRVQYQSFGLNTRLPESQEVILFRVTQELLNNIMKHSGASQVLIQLVQDGKRIHLTVEDNGKGFDTEILHKAPGIGWLNIKSRVDYLAGTLQLRSQPGQGTTVEIEFMQKDKA